MPIEGHPSRPPDEKVSKQESEGTTVEILQFVLRLGAALLMGACIGLERQWRHRTAGTRTKALVAGGAAAFVMSGTLVPGDPTAQGRIVSYVVSGVGFLGAGVIFKESAQIRGLNTAATIWCSAAVGVITALGYVHYAAIVMGGVLLANTALRPLAYHLYPAQESGGEQDVTYSFEVICNPDNEAHIRALLLQAMTQGGLTRDAELPDLREFCDGKCSL